MILFLILTHNARYHGPVPCIPWFADWRKDEVFQRDVYRKQ
jgi:hypothetical protein